MPFQEQTKSGASTATLRHMLLPRRTSPTIESSATWFGSYRKKSTQCMEIQVNSRIARQLTSTKQLRIIQQPTCSHLPSVPIARLCAHLPCRATRSSITITMSLRVIVPSTLGSMQIWSPVSRRARRAERPRNHVSLDYPLRQSQRPRASVAMRASATFGCKQHQACLALASMRQQAMQAQCLWGL